MFFLWQVLWASSAHSHLLLRLKIMNLSKCAAGMMCAVLRHVVCLASPTAPTSSPAWATPVPGTRNGVQPVLPGKGHGAQWCPLGFPVIRYCLQANGTCPTSQYWRCRNQTLIWPVVGMSPGHPLHMWGQSESSRAKSRLAQLSQFLTPADSTDKKSTLTFLNVQGYGLEVTSIWSKPCPRQGPHRSWPPSAGGSRATAQKWWWMLHQPPWWPSTTSSRLTAHPSN